MRIREESQQRAARRQAGEVRRAIRVTALASLLVATLGAGLGAGMLLAGSGCATVGREFPVDRVGEIRMQQTTQEEIRAMFGEPWRVGVEDGRLTWTYGRYRYRLFGQPSTQDLVLRFDDRGIVVSYTFNTTEHEQATPVGR